MKKENNKIAAFIKYALSFYGKDGLYPYNCSDDVVASVAKFYALKSNDFNEDSIDRENVSRMLEALGYYELG